MCRAQWVARCEETHGMWRQEVFSVGGWPARQACSTAFVFADGTPVPSDTEDLKWVVQCVHVSCERHGGKREVGPGVRRWMCGCCLRAYAAAQGDEDDAELDGSPDEEADEEGGGKGGAPSTAKRRGKHGRRGGRSRCRRHPGDGGVRGCPEAVPAPTEAVWGRHSGEPSDIGRRARVLLDAAKRELLWKRL